MTFAKLAPFNPNVIDIQVYVTEENNLTLEAFPIHGDTEKVSNMDVTLAFVELTDYEQDSVQDNDFWIEVSRNAIDNPRYGVSVESWNSFINRGFEVLRNIIK